MPALQGRQKSMGHYAGYLFTPLTTEAFEGLDAMPTPVGFVVPGRL